MGIVRARDDSCNNAGCAKRSPAGPEPVDGFVCILPGRYRGELKWTYRRSSGTFRIRVA